jgi:hypothetical protein
LKIYAKTGLFLSKAEKIEFSIMYHIPLQMNHAEVWGKKTLWNIKKQPALFLLASSCPIANYKKKIPSYFVAS